MEKYKNRIHAGMVLAKQLEMYQNHKDVLVLALPRGGVPVAAEISRFLNVPLDVFIVRKLGVPGHNELAMGAIAMGNVVVYNQEIIEDLQIPQSDIDLVIANEIKELNRRIIAYRGKRDFPVLTGKTIILVDDGIATGATMRAAIQALKKLHPLKLVVAVPVAEKRTCEEFATQVDEFICPLRPLVFNAVGAWYDDFSQTEDDEVHALLQQTSMLDG